MKERNLIIFGGISESKSYIQDNPCGYSKYQRYIEATSSAQIQGLCGKIDILFLRGWWGRRQSSEILDILHIYMGAYSAKFIGDMDFVPPYLSDRYNSLNRSEEASNPVKNRFELLDL